MRFPILYFPFYIGLGVYFIAMLFKILHWPEGQLLIMVAILVLCLFFAMVLVEMVSSKKADMSKKVLWGVLYTIVGLTFLLFLRGLLSMLFLLALGLIYTRVLRKQFLFTQKEIEINNREVFKPD